MLKTRAPAVCALVLALSATTGFADPINYQEAVSGDLWYMFPNVQFAFDVGVNTVSGNFFYIRDGPVDWDSFAFSIPAGAVLTNISFFHQTTYPPGNHPRAQVNLIFGNSAAPFPPPLIVPTEYLWFELGSPLTPFTAALPLGPGVYGLWHSGNNWPSFETDYTWAFTVESTSTVPEPASLLLLGTGLAGLVAARRRRP